MKTKLRSSSSPYKTLYLSTPGRWRSPSTGIDGPDLSKQCRVCQRVLLVLEFIVLQELRTLGGAQYLVYTDHDNACRNCYTPCTDFRLHYEQGLRRKSEVHIRLDLHDSSGAAYELWDPKAEKWRPLIERGIRLMDKKHPSDPHQLAFQPYDDRQHDRSGRRYGRGQD